MIEKLDILAFGAHPDDVEISASGTIMKHIANGLKVGVVDLTEGELGSRGNVEKRYAEAEVATKLMGIHTRVNLKMADGLFEINEANKRLIVEQIRKFQPKVVLANAVNDRHPDHGRGSQLVSEACFLAGLTKFKTSVGGVEQEAYRPNAVYHYIQDRYVEPDFVVDVSEFHERKLEAIQAYTSQFYNPNSIEPDTPISGEGFLKFISARMIEFGRSINVEYAEGFTVERSLGVKNIMDIL